MALGAFYAPIFTWSGWELNLQAPGTVAGAFLISALSVVSVGVSTVKGWRRFIPILVALNSVFVMLHQAWSLRVFGFRIPQLISFMLCSCLTALPLLRKKSLVAHVGLVMAALFAMDDGVFRDVVLCGGAGILISTLALELRIREREASELRSLRKQQELEYLAITSRAQGLADMAGGVAHEINNPLAIIQATSDRMKAAAPSKDLEAIDRGVRRIAGIVERLARCASQPDEQEPAVVPASALAQTALDYWRARISEADIQLKVVGDQEILVLCRLDQVAQALSNLIQNSIDAVEGADVRWIELCFEQEGTQARILVTDSGARIPREVSDRMMNPFFTTKGVGKGTGLGLSAARGLIESNQGELWYDRHAAHTRFVVELPVAREGELDRAA